MIKDDAIYRHLSFQIIETGAIIEKTSILVKGIIEYYAKSQGEGIMEELH
jgi:hypothetical protein